MDSMFGIGLQGLDYFMLMYVHPETQISLPLAFFIRKRGSEKEPHPLVPDLRWMEQVLQQRFGFPAPRYIIVDKCMGSLSAQAQLVKADWASQRMPIEPLIAASAFEGPHLRDHTLVLYASQAVLRGIAAGCSTEEFAALSAYLVQRTGSSWDHPFPTVDCDIGPSTAEAARHVFGDWAIHHPTLVRGLAQRLYDMFETTQRAVAECAENAGAIDAALSELQSHVWAIADNDSAVSVCSRLLVER